MANYANVSLFTFLTWLPQMSETLRLKQVLVFWRNGLNGNTMVQKSSVITNE